MRLLFCSFASPGFLFPLVGLALELRRRGHEPAFASGLGAAPVLSAAGLARLPRGEKDGDSFNVAQWFHAVANAVDVKHIEHAIGRHRPDALVTHHLCLSALAAAERAGLPVAVLGPLTYLWEVPRPELSEMSQATLDRRVWRLDEGIRTLNELRKLCRLPEAERTAEDHGLLGDLFMLRTTPELERDLESLPRRVHAAGPCAWEPEPALGEAEAWAALEASLAERGDPVVYVHNGRSFGGPTFWPQLVRGLGDAPVRVMGSVGRMDQEVGALPPNFLVRAHVPQELVLRRARAVVAGGHSTVAIGALMHGVPSVLIPYGVDTPDNAERLARAGCARSLDIEGLTPGGVRDAVDFVLADETIRRGCARLRDSFREAASFELAASLVETMGAQGPVLRPEPAVHETAVLV